MTNKLEGSVKQLAMQGRYRSASKVVREGLRIPEIREAQLQPKPTAKKKKSKS